MSGLEKRNVAQRFLWESGVSNPAISSEIGGKRKRKAADQLVNGSGWRLVHQVELQGQSLRVLMLCYVMLCYVMSCYVLLCYVMLCYVVSWYESCMMLRVKFKCKID